MPSLSIFRIAFLPALLGAAALAGEEAEPSRYRLQVGAATFDVVVGEPFRVSLRGGEGIDAVLRRGKARWSGRGLSFLHPADMAVETSERRSLVEISLTRGYAVKVLLHLHPAGTKSPEAALAGAVAALGGMIRRLSGAAALEEPRTQEIAGEKRKGVLLTGGEGKDPPCAAVFAFPFGKRVLVISVLTRRSDREEAEAVLRVIARSLALAGEEPDGKPAKPPAEFELKVGEKTYPVRLDRRFQIEIPGGKTFPAVLRRGRKTCALAGIRFVHPGDTVASTEEKPGRVMIQVKHGRDYFASLQLYMVPGLSRDTVQSVTVKAVKGNVERTGRRFGPEKPCRRRFLGKTRTGTRLATIQGEDPYISEIYTFEIGPRVISVLFFYRESNRKTAARTFQMIAGSLREDR